MTNTIKHFVTWFIIFQLCVQVFWRISYKDLLNAS